MSSSLSAPARSSGANETAAVAMLQLLAAEIAQRQESDIDSAVCYGVSFANDTFELLDEGAAEARADELNVGEVPNFTHFSSGMRCWFYKHFNRSFRVVAPDGVSLTDVLADCVSSLEPR